MGIEGLGDAFLDKGDVLLQRPQEIDEHFHLEDAWLDDGPVLG